ncbi:MAG: three component ABC system middle component [bacterium]
MRAWEYRSAEEANLLNPPFVGGICFEVIKGYCDKTKKDAPYILPFLAIPLVLHKNTRDSLPATVRATFGSWALSPEGTLAKMKYAAHAKSLVPIVKEAVSYMLKNKSLSITQDGNFELGDNDKLSKQTPSDFTDEVKDCFKRATFCGKWFACAGKIETVMALLGVKP